MAGSVSALISGAMVAGAMQIPAQAEVSRARVEVSITHAPAFDAPVGRKGGISNPVAFCSDSSEPTTTWTLTNTGTGWTRTWRWRGSLPGQYFPRVPVGTYVSKAAGTCRGVEKTRTEKITVAEKTLAGTVSREEWSRIHLGMTRAQVARIVGNDGRDPFRYDGKVSVTYDVMAFWSWSTIQYRDGRVVAKLWNVPHD